MNAIAEIRRIESDLYRFLQTTSEARRLVHDYLGDLFFKNYLTQDEHDEEVFPLKEELESSQEEAKSFREIVESIRDSIQETKFLPYKGPEVFIALIEEIVGTIQSADSDVIIDSSHITDDLSSIESTLEEEKATAETCLNSDTATISHELQTEPQTTPQHENTIVQTRRQLPCFSTGKRAA